MGKKTGKKNAGAVEVVRADPAAQPPGDVLVLPDPVDVLREAASLVDEDDDPSFAGVVLHDLAEAHRDAGDDDAAVATLERAAELKRRGGRAGDLAVTLRTLASTRVRLGAPRRALEALEEAIAVLRPVETSRRSFVEILVAAGDLLHDMNRSADAAGCFGEAAQLLADGNPDRTPLGSPRELATVLDRLARAFVATGQADAAQQARVDSADILQSVASLDDVDDVLWMARQAADIGDLARARSLVARATSLIAGTGADTRPIASLHLTIGRSLEAFAENDRPELLQEAMREYECALKLVDPDADPGFYGVIEHDIADIHLAQGRVAAAVSGYRSAIEHKSRTTAQADLARTWFALGEAHARQAIQPGDGWINEAVAGFDRAVELVDAEIDVRFCIRVMSAKARVCSRAGRLDDALKLYQQAVEQSRHGAVGGIDIARLLAAQARALADRGDPEAALRTLDDVIDIVRDNPRQVAEIRLEQGALLLRIGRPADAVPQFADAVNLLESDGAGDAYATVEALDQLAAAHHAADQSADAERISATALEILVGQVERCLAEGTPYGQHQVAELLIDRGALTHARRLIDAATEQLTDDDGPAAGRLGRTFERLGKRGQQDAFAMALTLYEMALTKADADADPGYYGMLLRDLGDVHAAEDRPEAAVERYRAAVEYLRRGELAAETVEVLIGLGRARLRLPDGDSPAAQAEAIDAVTGALDLSDPDAEPHGYGRLLRDLGGLQLARGLRDEAVGTYLRSSEYLRRGDTPASDLPRTLLALARAQRRGRGEA